jgi:hypothetical protein
MRASRVLLIARRDWWIVMRRLRPVAVPFVLSGLAIVLDIEVSRCYGHPFTGFRWDPDYSLVD